MFVSPKWFDMISEVILICCFLCEFLSRGIVKKNKNNNNKKIMILNQADLIIPDLHS